MAKRTNNQSVIENFFQGIVCESHNGNLWISQDGKRLMNYSTCLVNLDEEFGLIVNRTKYSVTTSKIQTYIMSAIHREMITNFTQVYNVQQSTSYLWEAAKKQIQATQELLGETK